jgi:hypothetical protein
MAGRVWIWCISFDRRCEGLVGSRIQIQLNVDVECLEQNHKSLLARKDDLIKHVGDSASTEKVAQSSLKFVTPKCCPP